MKGSDPRKKQRTNHDINGPRKRRRPSKHTDGSESPLELLRHGGGRADQCAVAQRGPPVPEMPRRRDRRRTPGLRHRLRRRGPGRLRRRRQPRPGHRRGRSRREDTRGGRPREHPSGKQKRHLGLHRAGTLPLPPPTFPLDHQHHLLFKLLTNSRTKSWPPPTTMTI